MKKKIFAVVLLILLSSVSALAVWQWDNIMAVVDGIRYDEEQITQKAQSSAQQVEEYFEKNELNKVTPLTPEQEEALQNGEITSEDAIKIMTGEMTFDEAKENTKSNQPSPEQENTSVQEADKPEDNEEQIEEKSKSMPESDVKSETKSTEGNNQNKEQPGNGSSDGSASEKRADTQQKPESDNSSKKPAKASDSDSTKKEAASEGGKTDAGNGQSKAPSSNKNESASSSSGVDYDSLISEKVAQLYVVKSNFYGRFNARYAQVRAEFLKRPKSEDTRENVAAVVRSCIPEGLAMERECDAQVEAILSELTSLLKSAGRDLSLVDSIRSAYNSEKSALKSRLISKYF